MDLILPLILFQNESFDKKIEEYLESNDIKKVLMIQNNEKANIRDMKRIYNTDHRLNTETIWIEGFNKEEREVYNYFCENMYIEKQLNKYNKEINIKVKDSIFKINKKKCFLRDIE